MQIKKIAIVGGGTAGWLVANHLGKTLKDKSGISISLIESPDIPPIGVGEGTVPEIKNSLAKFGISESEFIRRCDVTFKQSIKFINWLDKSKHGENNFYHHLFDAPSRFGDDLTPKWLNQSRQHNYGDFVSAQHSICEQGLAPKAITDGEYQGELAYSYHLNAAKFAVLLAENAKEKFSVEHIKANINKAILGPDGNIQTLSTDSAGELAFDFYIDCSGFNSILLGKALQVPFVDKSDQLFVDKALVVQVPTSKDSEIPPYTLATAHQAGWIWDIALPDRRGVGFVYSSAHMSDAQASAKLDHYLGKQGEELTYRTLPMKIGYREKFWHKNCVAMGLAQGFLEPLEATSILLTDLAANMLANRFPDTLESMPLLADRFNHAMRYSWEGVVDFIKLHYCLSDRSDSNFWVDNRQATTIPDSLSKKLDLWQNYTPRKDDFFSQFEVFFWDNYLYVLYGMKFNTQPLIETAGNNEHSLYHQKQIKDFSQFLTNKLPKHRELLDKIQRYGLQKQ
jgi:tryptophan halogenase